MDSGTSGIKGIFHPGTVLCQDNLYQNDFVLNNLTAGQTYYVRVYSQNSNAHDFDLCLMTLPPPPANAASTSRLLAASASAASRRMRAISSSTNFGCTDSSPSPSRCSSSYGSRPGFV